MIKRFLSRVWRLLLTLIITPFYTIMVIISGLWELWSEAIDDIIYMD